jgi:predicted transcriptional regulator of viral defense system
MSHECAQDRCDHRLLWRSRQRLLSGFGSYCLTHTSGKIEGMGDVAPSNPDHCCLFAVASSQHGYFTSSQARSCGFTSERLSDGARRGKYARLRRGLYRLRDYPTFPREEVVAAWLALGKDRSVVSHESALDLLGLSDVIPHAIHLTVPRSRRNLPNLRGVRIHTTTKSFGPLDIVTRDGIRLTSAGRTILDAAEWGTAPEQIEMAIQQAAARGLLTRTQLAQAAGDRSKQVQDLVNNALQ